LNPGVTLPDLAIQAVARADTSGTSFVFTDYLSKVSEEFKKTVGASTAPNWPTAVGIKQNKSDGVAGHISRTDGALGYIELTYAMDTKATYGNVVNAAGKPMAATLASITAAADASLGTKPTAEPYNLHDLTYNLTNAAGDASYPIAAMSYAILYSKQKAPEGAAVLAFLTWATSESGQKIAEKRNYAMLPAKMQEQVLAKLKTVSVEP
ncbi:MAG: substrate-binding domain-containing protein, partial [Gemmataceae bacterium]